VAIFVDMRRAFPRIDRQKLADCLAELGVPVESVDIIADFLSLNRFRVKTATHYSPWAPVNVGVRGGGVLSPLLFSLFIAHVTRKVFPRTTDTPKFESDEEAEDGIFPDDIVFFCYLLIQAAQTRLKLWLYCQEKRLVVNVDKTEVLVFKTSSAAVARTHTLSYNSVLLPSTSEFTVSIRATG
jgi:hypothetical protein